MVEKGDRADDRHEHRRNGDAGQDDGRAVGEPHVLKEQHDLEAFAVDAGKAQQQKAAVDGA